MGSHDHKVGFHFNRDIVNVIEQVANSRGGTSCPFEILQMLLGKLGKPFPLLQFPVCPLRCATDGFHCCKPFQQQRHDSPR